MNGTRCVVCGKGALHEKIGDFTANFKDDSGRPRTVVVHDVKKFECDACGEFFLDGGSEERISAAQRDAMGLLGSAALRQFRKRIGKKQEEMSDLLGLGKKTWCRWESEDYFQSEAFDRYIRLLMFAPANVRALELIGNSKVEESPADLTVAFQFVRDIPSAERAAEQFEPVLVEGPFTN